MIETIGRYDVATETWMAQEYDEETKRWRDVVPAREADEHEIDRAVEMPTHEGWKAIVPSRDTPHHWLTFDRDDDGDEPDPNPIVRFHCDAPVGADCRFTCDDGCEAFPCRHEPSPADCWAEPWISGNRALEVMNDEEVAARGFVDNALARVDWEGDYALVGYQENNEGPVLR